MHSLLDNLILLFAFQKKPRLFISCSRACVAFTFSDWSFKFSIQSLIGRSFELARACPFPRQDPAETAQNMNAE